MPVPVREHTHAYTLSLPSRSQARSETDVYFLEYVHAGSANEGHVNAAQKTSRDKDFLYFPNVRSFHNVGILYSEHGLHLKSEKILKEKYTDGGVVNRDYLTNIQTAG